MRRGIFTALLLALLLVGSGLAANYVFERSVIKGVGYRSHELVGQTADGHAGQKIAERVSGSGSFYDSTVFEMDVNANYINFSQEAEFEYFPTSYQTGTYDQKWIDSICVRNYDAGAVFVEAYRDAEHLQKSTEIVTIGNGTNNVLEAHINSNVIGTAHIGWRSTETQANDKGRFVQLGTSREDLTGVFSIEKYVQLRKNSTDADGLTDWLACA